LSPLTNTTRGKSSTSDRAGNLLEIVTALRDDGTEIVIHAMKMRRIYEPLLGEIRESDG